MATNISVLPAETPFAAFLRDHGDESRLEHIVVTRGARIAGVLRVNTALRRGVEESYSVVTLGDIAQRSYTIAHEDDIIFDVITRMWRHGATMVVVTRARGKPKPADIVGVITKEHIADSVAASIKPYSP
jgi:CIC family chloride channel protein